MFVNIAHSMIVLVQLYRKYTIYFQTADVCVHIEN